MMYLFDLKWVTLPIHYRHILCNCIRVMSVQIRDFLDVAARARELGCRVPFGIALLPGNSSAAACASEFCYHAATPYVRSAWRSLGLTDAGPNLMLKKAPARVMTASAGHDRNSPGILDRVPSGSITAESGTRDLGLETSSEIRTPIPNPQPPVPFSCDVPLVAFFGRELRSRPARTVTYALAAVAAAVSAHLAHADESQIRLDAVVQRPGRGSYACIEYRGDACELVALAGAVREILTGSPSLGADDDEGT